MFVVVTNLTKGQPMTPGLEVDHGAGVLLGKLDHVLLYELSHPVARSITLQNMVSQPQLKMDIRISYGIPCIPHRFGTYSHLAKLDCDPR